MATQNQPMIIEPIEGNKMIERVEESHISRGSRDAFPNVEDFKKKMEDLFHKMVKGIDVQQEEEKHPAKPYWGVPMRTVMIEKNVIRREHKGKRDRDKEEYTKIASRPVAIRRKENEKQVEELVEEVKKKKSKSKDIEAKKKRGAGIILELREGGPRFTRK